MCDCVTHEGDLDPGAASQHGAWVRSARKYGSILVRDRHRPVARITPASGEPEVNRFAAWKPLKNFAARLDRPVRGTPVEEIVSKDRDR
jgi:antitoxin (DNA-binding transcriptional repressor) of toxin-antitoxin stability system